MFVDPTILDEWGDGFPESEGFNELVDRLRNLIKEPEIQGKESL